MFRIAVPYQVAREVTLAPAEVPANTAQVEEFDMVGLVPDMCVFVRGQTLEAGLYVMDARVLTRDKLTLTFINFTGAPIAPAQQAFRVIAF